MRPTKLSRQIGVADVVAARGAVAIPTMAPPEGGAMSFLSSLLTARPPEQRVVPTEGRAYTIFAMHLAIKHDEVVDFSIPRTAISIAPLTPIYVEMDNAYDALCDAPDAADLGIFILPMGTRYDSSTMMIVPGQEFVVSGVYLTSNVNHITLTMTSPYSRLPPFLQGDDTLIRFAIRAQSRIKTPFAAYYCNVRNNTELLILNYDGESVFRVDTDSHVSVNTGIQLGDIRTFSFTPMITSPDGNSLILKRFQPTLVRPFYFECYTVATPPTAATRLWQIDLNTTLAQGKFYPESFSFSPDSSAFAFLGEEGEGERRVLYVYRHTTRLGEQPVLLRTLVCPWIIERGEAPINDRRFSSQTFWSPDGSKIGVLIQVRTTRTGEKWGAFICDTTTALVSPCLLIRYTDYEEEAFLGALWSINNFITIFSSNAIHRLTYHDNRLQYSGDMEVIHGTSNEIHEVVFNGNSNIVITRHYNSEGQVVLRTYNTGTRERHYIGVYRGLPDIRQMVWSPDATKIWFTSRTKRNIDEITLRPAAPG